MRGTQTRQPGGIRRQIRQGTKARVTITLGNGYIDLGAQLQKRRTDLCHKVGWILRWYGSSGAKPVNPAELYRLGRFDLRGIKIGNAISRKPESSRFRDSTVQHNRLTLQIFDRNTFMPLPDCDGLHMTEPRDYQFMHTLRPGLREAGQSPQSEQQRQSDHEVQRPNDP